MIYENIRKGRFISRPNRFIAHVMIDGKEEICHVKNTGRCRELLTDNAEVILEENFSKTRKTKFDLIAVYKNGTLINMDSQAPNKVFYEWAGTYFRNMTLLRPETQFASSRFDAYIEADGKKIFAEVKGVTLEENGVLMFPDAPTERGLKHIHELEKCVSEGFCAYLFFVCQIDGVKYFTPNKKTHPEFCKALKEARKKGVNIVCVDCIVKENSLSIKDFVEIRL